MTMGRGPFGTGFWGLAGPRHKPWDTVHTGVLCPFCQVGELVVEYDGSITRWGADGYVVSCTNHPTQGAICPWVESEGGDYDGHPIPEASAQLFAQHRDDVEAQASLLREAVPKLQDAVLKPYLVEENEMLIAYGPPFDNGSWRK